jgi:hypothetical protein
MDRSLNVTMVNQLLRGNDVIVTLQWPQEAGAVSRQCFTRNITH